MRIIKNGTPQFKEFAKTCSYCSCEFVYTTSDVQRDARDGDYVVCPWCKKFLSHNQ